MYSLKCLLAGFATLLLSQFAVTPVSAQSQTGGAESGSDLEEIVVTARRRDESILRVPESISVFTEALIADAEIRSIDDFSRLTPGVTVQQGFQGGDTPILTFRGVGQRGGSAPTILILTDGVFTPAGDPLRNQMFDIQQIEVVKGPQGSLYGRDSIGGVINVVTNPPANELSGGIEASYVDESSELRVAGALNVPVVEDKFSLRLAASSLESDGFFTNLSGAKHDTRDEQFVRVRALIRPTDTLSFDVRLSRNEFNNNYNSGFYGANADTYISSVGNVLNVADYADGFHRREVTDAAMKITWDLGPATITSITQNIEADESMSQDADFGLAPGLQIVRDTGVVDDAFSQEIRIASPDADAFRWLFGAFYEDSNLGFSLADEEVNLPLGPLGSSSNKTDVTRKSIFGQVDFDLSDTFTSSLALRHDKSERELQVLTPVPSIGSTEATRTSPKLSLSYGISENSTVYVTYGEGFRSGGFDAVTNIPYDDEDLASIELGYKAFLLDGKLFFTAAAYQIKHDKQQIAVVTLDQFGNLITTTENLGETESKGLEFGLVYQTDTGFDFSAGIDFMDSKVKSDPDLTLIGNSTPFSTDFTANLAGQYTRAVGAGLDLKARLEYYYQGDQTWDTSNTFVQDAYGLLSARVALEGERWHVAISGQNVLDEEYNDQLFPLLPTAQFVYPGRPARWTLSAGWSF